MKAGNEARREEGEKKKRGGRGGGGGGGIHVRERERRERVGKGAFTLCLEINFATNYGGLPTLPLYLPQIVL